MDVSGTLSKIMTANAPAFIALLALSTKVHSPLSIIAILPIISFLLTISEHEWNGLTKAACAITGLNGSVVKCDGPAERFVSRTLSGFLNDTD
jgi:hypothetical protein